MESWPDWQHHFRVSCCLGLRYHRGFVSHPCPLLRSPNAPIGPLKEWHCPGSVTVSFGNLLRSHVMPLSLFPSVSPHLYLFFLSFISLCPFLSLLSGPRRELVGVAPCSPPPLGPIKSFLGPQSRASCLFPFFLFSHFISSLPVPTFLSSLLM